MGAIRTCRQVHVETKRLTWFKAIKSTKLFENRKPQCFIIDNIATMPVWRAPRHRGSPMNYALLSRCHQQWGWRNLMPSPWSAYNSCSSAHLHVLFLDDIHPHLHVHVPYQVASSPSISFDQNPFVDAQTDSFIIHPVSKLKLTCTKLPYPS